MYPRQVKYAVYYGGGYLFYGLRTAIKGGGGRADNTTCKGHSFHVADMNEVVRCITHHAEQASSFFQYYIGGAGDKIIGHA